ncbi:MAG: hypothetical protein MJE68_23905, partial [Proteobacteria bacterium]|nr:hypothetical protein [Pseudomonadota bacterium]
MPNRTVSETAQTPVTDTPVTTRETSTIFHTASPEADNPVSLSNTSLTCAPENVPELPQFTAMADPVFTWGECDSVYFVNKLNAAYKEAVHWRPNLFKVPYGKAGKSFISELARLFKAFATGSALESIALKAATLLPILQKPARRSKAKDHSTCLERRLNTWLGGDLDELLKEGRTIQQRIPKASPSLSNDRLAHSFANLMFHGKTRAALRLLSDECKGAVLQLD